MFFLDNIIEVNLTRDPKGLGLSLSGGLAEGQPITITDIHENQPAARSGKLEVGDVVLSINDTPMHERNVQVSSI